MWNRKSFLAVTNITLSFYPGQFTHPCIALLALFHCLISFNPFLGGLHSAQVHSILQISKNSLYIVGGSHLEHVASGFPLIVMPGTIFLAQTIHNYRYKRLLR